ncbi:MAG: phosphoribosylformylglycinamidine cyclo-ligase [Deltaproteobacteria bacterium]|nr:phosphoribosylformylglycinamidine cyclo-ligase [Deltaproteobacteria bacterium]
MTENHYEALGASSSKSGLHRALESAGVQPDSRFFASINSDLAGESKFSSFIHCDGAGTKSLIAYLNFVETKDPSSFSGLAQDALVMNLDDVYCLGPADALLAANAIARNPRLITDDAVSAIILGYKQIIEKLSAMGISIELSGGETADCPDVVRTLLVDAVITGRITNANLINANSIQPGDVIVGLSSTGQASYEDFPNSGISSNGLTLARHALLSKHYLTSFEESRDPHLDSSLVYRGPFRLSDCPNELDMNIGRALLSPTRTYAPVLSAIYKAMHGKIHAAIHNTGGGQTKVLRFGGPGLLFRKTSLFDIPPLFALIQKHGNVSWKEMYQVFNMGHRMELYLAKDDAASAIDIADKFGLKAKIVGHVENKPSAITPKNTVILETPHGMYTYELS